MSAEDRSVPGRTTLTGRALQHLAVALVRDSAGVPARSVSVSLADEGGKLCATVVVPVRLEREAEPRGSLIDQGAAARAAVIDGMLALSGRNVGAVDVRFSGVYLAQEQRVR